MTTNPLNQVLTTIHAHTALACTELGVPVPKCCAESLKADTERMREHWYAEELANEDRLSELRYWEARNKGRDIQ